MKPPLKPPLNMMEHYTMGGRVEVRYRYADNSQAAAPETYTRAAIDVLVAEAAHRRRNYYALDPNLFRALDAFPIAKMDVAVVGSLVPWYEAVCLSRGARPFTIEYNEVDYQHPQITTTTVAEFDKSPRTFDAAFSISTFEHTGLGRYGDPLNPEGDLDAMAEMRKVVKPKGLLFLAVPVGRDAVVWNAHRIYASIRLPRLLHGWTCVGTFGYDVHKAEDSVWTQPVFVLRNDYPYDQVQTLCSAYISKSAA